MNTDTKIKELDRELADKLTALTMLGDKLERELADALTAIAMLGDRHERDLAEAKQKRSDVNKHTTTNNQQPTRL